MPDSITLSREEYQDLLRKANGPRYVYGIDGLCEIFGCSRSTAKRMKKDGGIKKAIRQQGRTFVTNVDLALQLYGARNNRTF